MEKFVIEGPNRLCGEVNISRAKNAVLPILAAALLCQEKVRIQNAPALSDVETFSAIFSDLGVSHTLENGEFSICADRIGDMTLSDRYAQKMRASILVMGPLLARCGKVCVSMPGGCAIGSRPIDLHLAGFEKLGAKISLRDGFVCAHASRGLAGAPICLDFPSVGATENLMMAAVLASGETRIDNAAREPEIVDLARFLCRMGAQIRGAGTDTVLVTGVRQETLHGHSFSPMFDRMEAATFMIAAAASGGDILLRGAKQEHLRAVCAKLVQTGAQILPTPDGLRIRGSERILPTEVRTMQYPGFPTDAQAPMTALLSLAHGTSVITETIFENRFMHAAQLARMGARILVENRTAILYGVDRLYGASVEATDLRAGAALMIAANCAQGQSEIAGAAHILRGYERTVEKWRSIGARIYLEKGSAGDAIGRK